MTFTAKRGILPPDSVTPAKYEKWHVSAFQALDRGDATPEQQKLILPWLLMEACKIHDVSYRKGDTHETAFCEGRRFAGLQVAKMIKLNLNAFKGE